MLIMLKQKFNVAVRVPYSMLLHVVMNASNESFVLYDAYGACGSFLVAVPWQ